jgi:DNA-binding XRE family transcriptional regulator
MHSISILAAVSQLDVIKFASHIRIYNNRISFTNWTFLKVEKENMSEYINFPTMLKILRQRNGLTQESLSSAAGLNHTSISLLESGKRKPTLNTVEKLAAVFELETWEFVKLLAERQETFISKLNIHFLVACPSL